MSPIKDVEGANGRFRATSREPWLRFSLADQIEPGDLAEITYSAGLTETVTRPVLRFWTGVETFRDAILPAPSLGRGVWRGRIPENLTAIWLSPTQTPGDFFFSIDEIRPLTLMERARSFLSEPKRAFFAFSAGAVGLREESSVNFSWMLGQAEAQDYWRWREAHVAPASAGPRSFSPPLVVFLLAREECAIRASYESLTKQSYENWRLAVIGAPLLPLTLAKDARVSWHSDLTDAPAPADGLVLMLVAGDELEPVAIDCLIAEFQRRPGISVLYADHVQKSRAGSPTPVLKPDWSPLRQANAPYVGRAAVVASRLVNGLLFPAGAFSPESAVDNLLASVDGTAVGHVRRPLFRLAEEGSVSPRGFQRAVEEPQKISIIVPSRDRADLLEPCIRSIFARTSYSGYEVIIVDNGSVEPKTERLYDAFKNDFSHFDIIPEPGPFNFSRLCNRGAKHAAGAFLLFLNNDTEVLQADWLENLLELARRPEVGAVGANLLFPNDRVQHAGVVLGFGGVAGHFEEGMKLDASGWLGGRHAPHEVSAVTGACLMVQRDKFSAIGGFDEVNLPVELNDIDLCLRLSECGWRAVCDGRTRLRHHCSASRGGRNLRLQRVYEKERRYFRNRWLHLIRDDPYFNPNLSLYRHRPSWG